MGELCFQIKGSAGKTHEVIVRKKDKNMTVLCSCSKGKDKLCKHQIFILTGRTEGIVSNNTDDAKRVLHWFEGTDVGTALFRLKDATKQVEKDKIKLKESKEKLALAKSILIKAIND